MSVITSPFPQITSPPQALAEVLVNEALGALSHQAVYGYAYQTSSGLTWGYYGGRWGGFSIAAGTLTLTANDTNDVVVEIATGAISVGVGTDSAWDDQAFVRVYRIVTGASAVTSAQDHRAGPGGVHGGSGAVTSRGVLALTDGATISVNASANDQFRVTLGGNRTLANPTGMIDGQTLLFRIKQDGTGTRTLAYGSKYKFPGGSVTLSTPAASLDLLTCQYDATDDTLACVLSKAFA